MGSLKPGATYIYERDGKKIYAREMGAHPGDRKLIGYDYDGSGRDTDKGLEKFIEDWEWEEIRNAAKTNRALQQALEDVKLLYELVKQHKEEPGWHPV